MRLSEDVFHLSATLFFEQLLLQGERKRMSWKMVEEDCEGLSRPYWLLLCELRGAPCGGCRGPQMHLRSEGVRRCIEQTIGEWVVLFLTRENGIRLLDIDAVSVFCYV